MDNERLELHRAAAWDFLLNEVLISEESLNIVTDVAGYSYNTLELVLYSVTGYNDFTDYAEDNNIDMSNYL